MHKSYTDDSLFNAVRKIALCIMPKDETQSFGHLLEDKHWLKREFKKLTSEFVNKKAIQLQNIYAQDQSFPKLAIDDSLKKLNQNTCRKSSRYQRTTCS